MLNMDFSQRIVIDVNAMDWESSPSSGVQRKPLAREHAESGHASAIVRYQPGSSFSRHAHPGGEEILVLEGTFSDEDGDYPAGTYLRNPPGSAHSPRSDEGCVLLVKLEQFAHGDDRKVRLDTRNAPWRQGQGNLQVLPLHDFEGEHTALVKWPANEHFAPHRHFGGEEILVLSGEFKDEFGSYPALSWIRSPHLSQHDPFVTEPTVIWVKVGHLPVT